ncbi:hypothetical protein [Brevundimonas sp.]|uniref:hypothetical protein n=1 Tax=Brevundimonas sp. TaxID=1871086 RepID=UPI0027380085|nr:hypothetical protein [Brevundimonas sp.]MDP3801312.1 hypothetical protein [Brevundimonas sp.]
MGSVAFSDKLTFVLKALSTSRGRFASELGVSKSLVGRWCSGSVHPSSYNMERITRLIAARCEGFTLVDWEREPEQLAAMFGVDPSAFAPKGDQQLFGISPNILAAARAATASRSVSYEGFWRVTRPAVVAPGRFCNDHGMFRPGPSGLLEFELGNPDLRFTGWALPIEGQLFVIATDTIGGLPSFLIFNGVPMPKTKLMDGIILTALNALRKPAAYPILLQRIGDLSGNPEADDAHMAELMKIPQFIEDGAVPDPVREHLLRDIGPKAVADGGELLLTASMTPSLMRLFAYFNPGESGA